MPCTPSSLPRHAQSVGSIPATSSIHPRHFLEKFQNAGFSLDTLLTLPRLSLDTFSKFPRHVLDTSATRSRHLSDTFQNAGFILDTSLTFPRHFLKTKALSETLPGRVFRTRSLSWTKSLTLHRR